MAARRLPGRERGLERLGVRVAGPFHVGKQFHAQFYDIVGVIQAVDKLLTFGWVDRGVEELVFSKFGELEVNGVDSDQRVGLPQVWWTRS